MSLAVRVAEVVAAGTPFADTLVGRIVVPLIGTILVGAVGGGIAWARYVTRTLSAATVAAADNAREARESTDAIRDLVREVHQLAINGAVTADSLQRHLDHHPGPGA